MQAALLVQTDFFFGPYVMGRLRFARGQADERQRLEGMKKS